MIDMGMGTRYKEEEVEIKWEDDLGAGRLPP